MRDVEKTIRDRLEQLIDSVSPGCRLEMDTPSDRMIFNLRIVKGDSALGPTVARAKDVLISELLEKNDRELSQWLKDISVGRTS